MEKLSAYQDKSRFEIPRTMKAVTLSGVGIERLAYTEVAVPEVGAGQLLCRVDAAGVCTSILKIIKQGPAHALVNGWDMERHPVILGDEGSLTVVKVGEELEGRYHVGQRVVIQPAVDVAPINHRERYADNAANMHKCSVGYTLGGYLADYLLVQEEVLEGQCVLKLPDESMGYYAVSMAEPISCVCSAQERSYHIYKAGPFAQRRAKLGLLKGGTTVIVGAGLMGRMHLEMAMRFRPANLIISDVAPPRLEKAVDKLDRKAGRLGINLLAVEAERLSETVTKVTGGAKADDVIVAVGIQSVQQDALGLLGKGGVANLYGGLSRGQDILEVCAIDVHYNEIRLVGSSGGEPSDMKAALRAIANRDIDPGNYVFGVGGLEHTTQVLEMMQENKVEGRVILYPHAQVDKLEFVDYWDRAMEDEFLNEHLRV